MNDHCMHVFIFAVKPRIDRTNLKTTTIRVGKQIFLDVDVTGEPAPDIKWFVVGGKEVTDTDRLTIENVPHNTKLKIVDGRRGDSGKYRIVATNEHGSDEEVVELVVLGPPSKPMGNTLTRISAQGGTVVSTMAHDLDAMGLIPSTR